VASRKKKKDLLPPSVMAARGLGNGGANAGRRPKLGQLQPMAAAVRLEPWVWRSQDFEADWYCSDGPGPILTTELIFQYSNHLQTLKFKTKIFLMCKTIQTWHDD
jgi:hypothetical protein